jgi:hypothetical protein
VSDVLLLEALVGPAIIAGLFLRLFFRDRGLAAMLEIAGMSIALALGFTSATFFLWRVTGMPLGGYPEFEVGLQVLMLGAALFLHRRRGLAGGDAPDHVVAPRAMRRFAGVMAAAAIAAAAVMFWHASATLPYGDSDAWAIWNLRAAFLVVPSDGWRAAFSPVIQWSHPDYPLLVSASIARLWMFGDAGAVAGPRWFAAAVVLASALVLAGSVWRRAGIVGVALALLLLFVPDYLHWGASQTADVPLGLFALIAVASLTASRAAHWYSVAGLAAGFAAWTKNEGLLVAAVVVLTAAALLMRSRRDWRLLGHLALGLATGTLALLVCKLTVGPASDLMRQIVNQHPLDKAVTVERHLHVAGYMLREMFTWGGWSPIPAGVLVVVSLAAAAARWRGVPREAVVGGGVAMLMLTAYYVIYVLSPYDLEWHLRTSLDRLVAQVWPIIVWTAVVATVEPARRAAATQPTG